MVDIFISYAHQDRPQAAELAHLLEEAGYTVWWDWKLAGGAQYREIIGAKIAEARKVIVLWSAQSVTSGFVIDEAQEAKDAKKLIPLVIDDTRPPLGFRDIHTIYIKKFHAVADVILASIEDKSTISAALARRKVKSRLVPIAAGVAVLVCLALAGSLTLLMRAPGRIDPSYKYYDSKELNLAFDFPSNILSLDDRARDAHRLVLRDGEGQQRIAVTRLPLPTPPDLKVGRDREVERLEESGYRVTYVAPENTANWSNWYVVSGLANNTVFYYRRWYESDAMVSMEFVFPKDQNGLYDELIPTMTKRLSIRQPGH